LAFTMYDARCATIRVSPHRSAGIAIRTIPNKEGRSGGPMWEPVNGLKIGELRVLLDDAIEKQCKAEDAQRRQAAAARRRGENGA
jgi:hypothetical protein